MDWLSALLLSIIASLAAMVIWEKVTQRKTNFYLDEKSLSLLNHALKLLPDLEREIYEEEWFMFLCDQTSARRRMLHAILFAYAAIKIRAEVRLVVPITAALAQPKLAMQKFKFEPVGWRYNLINKLYRFLTIMVMISAKIRGSMAENFSFKNVIESILLAVISELKVIFVKAVAQMPVRMIFGLILIYLLGLSAEFFAMYFNLFGG